LKENWEASKLGRAAPQFELRRGGPRRKLCLLACSGFFCAPDFELTLGTRIVSFDLFLFIYLEYYPAKVTATLRIFSHLEKTSGSTSFQNIQKVPSLVPIDKWMLRNATRVMAYRAIMDMFPDHARWNFLDEKHIVNGDTLPKKVRADPLTGYVDAIPVSGNFRDAHNIFAVVSGSPTKKKSIAYHITKASGNATQFVAFVKMLIVSDWFEHNKILVMDNAQIHTAEAECVEYYL
jgi:hypothetical protein